MNSQQNCQDRKPESETIHNSSTTPDFFKDYDGCFDCNICLDTANDPVATLCGHLYCWSCIFKWFDIRTSSSELLQHPPTCPVCKATISQAALIPLYGRGGQTRSGSESKEEEEDGGSHRHDVLVIPPRPTACGLLHHPLITSALSTTGEGGSSHPNNQQFLPSNTNNNANTNTSQMQLPDPPSLLHSRRPDLIDGNFTTVSSSSVLGGTAMASVINPTLGMLSEFVEYTGIFGSLDSAALLAYPYRPSNSFMGTSTGPPGGGASPRVRRQEMQLNKSLNRVSIFLFCCFVLCLLLF